MKPVTENYPGIKELLYWHMTDAGLTEADGAKLYKAKVKQDFLIGCLGVGITDVEEIILLSGAGVYAGDADRYRELTGGKLTAAQMIQLHGCGVTPWHLEQRYGKSVSAGEIESYIDTLSTAGVDADDLNTFEQYGITDPQVVAELVKEGVSIYNVIGFDHYGHQLTTEELVGYGRLNIEPYFITYLYEAGYRTPEKVAAAHRALLNNGSLQGFAGGSADISRLKEKREDAVERYGKLGEQLFDIHPWPRHVLGTLKRSVKLAEEIRKLDSQTLASVVTLAEENQETSAKELRGLIAVFSG